MRTILILIALLATTITNAQTKVTFNLNDTSSAESQAFSNAFNQALRDTDKNFKTIDYSYCKVNGNSGLTITGKLLTDVEYYNLKGSIKLIEEHAADIATNNLKITKTNARGTIIDSNGDNFVGAFIIDGKVQMDAEKPIDKEMTYFDKYGNTEKWINRNGIVRTYENIYDSEQRLICINIRGGKKNKTNKYKYDKQGRISKYKDSKVTYNNRGWINSYDGETFTYNTERYFTVLATEKLFDGKKVTKYIYDNNSLLKSSNTSNIMVSSTGSPIFGMPEESFTYDKKKCDNKQGLVTCLYL